LKEYKVILETTAELDLRGILDYITNILKQPQTAERIFLSIEEKVMTLNLMPARYNIVQDEPYATLGVRMMPVENYIQIRR
jgi:plasmid stabilization system protein ParE